MRPDAFGIRIGGPNAVSLFAWWLTLPAFLITVSSDGRWGHVATFLGFQAAGLLLIATGTRFRRQPDQSRPGLALAVFALTGCEAALAAGWLQEQMTGVSTRPSIWTMLAAAVIAVVWLGAGEQLIDAVRGDRAARGRVLRQLARERAIALLSASAVEEYRARIVEETQAVVTEQLRKASQVAADKTSAASQLTAIVDEVVRPLSRELSRDSVGEAALVEPVEAVADDPPVPFREYFRTARATLAFPWSIAIILMATAMLARSIWGVFAVLTLSLATSWAIGSVRARSVAVADELSAAVNSAEWASARLRQLAWSERQHLGQLMHGDTQARIVSLALRLQLDETTDVPQQLRLLDREISEQLAAKATGEGWRPTLDRVRAVWTYGLSLDIAVSNEAVDVLDADAVAGHALVEVVREAITNAVRHGSASAVSIAITSRDGGLVVRADDDGLETASVITPGLGSTMLDSVCLEWQLTTCARGHVLTALIPAEVTHA